MVRLLDCLSRLEDGPALPRGTGPIGFAKLKFEYPWQRRFLPCQGKLDEELVYLASTFRCPSHSSGNPSEQIIQLHLRRLPPIQDRLHDFRRQQRQAAGSG